MYNINIKRLVAWLIPSVFKSKTLPLLIRSFCVPIEQNYIAFMKKKEAVLYQLSHNSQVCYLTKLLNDKFDPDQKRISLEEIPHLQALYIYPQSDGSRKTLYLGQEIIRPKSDFDRTGVDFKVVLSSGLKLNQNEKFEMQSLINYYKLAGKQYIIT